MKSDLPNILVLHPLPSMVESELDRSFHVERRATDDDPTTEELVEAAARVDGIVSTVTDTVPATVFDLPGRRLRIIANFGVGVDLIDVAAAARRGVMITNTPDVLTDCTADLTIGLMIMVLRRLGEGERLVRAGAWAGWRPTHLLGRRVSGATLGIIGMGRIGQAVARRASSGFGMRVLYNSRSRMSAADERSLSAEWREIDELLRDADVVSLHCPLTSSTTNLLDQKRLALMRRDAVLINTARGALVDEEALIDALTSGAIGGAGLDVFGREPFVPPKLRALENVVVAPHLGSATVETRTAMGMKVVENLRAFFRGDPPPNQVIRT